MSCKASWGFIVLCILVLAAAGCSSRGPEIKGSVTLDGQPLAMARVTFEPVSNRETATIGVAFCDASGNFDMIPQAEGRTLNPAKYGVTVSRMADAQGVVPSAEDYGLMEASGALHESVPAKYTSIKPDGSYEIVIEIKDGEVEPLEIKLTSQ